MSRRLQLNAAKTELIWFGSKTTLRQSLPGARVLTIDVVLQPVEVVRDLGVLLDSQLTLKHLVATVILSRLDYCNSVLAGLPWSTVASLQRV